jgi:hypothetical protein
VSRPRPIPPHKLWLWRDLAILFVLCGVIGAGLDQLHVRSGTLKYEHPEFAGQAWWVMVQFAFNLVLVVWGATMIVNRKGVLGEPPVTPPGSWTGGRSVRSRIAIDFGWFAAAYALSAAPALDHHASTELLRGAGLVVLTGLAIVRLRMRGDRRIALVALALAFTGPLYEGFMASTRVFWYTNTDFHHVPIWLPALYANGAPFAASVGAWLDERGWRHRVALRSPAAIGQAQLTDAPRPR